MTRWFEHYAREGGVRWRGLGRDSKTDFVGGVTGQRSEVPCNGIVEKHTNNQILDNRGRVGSVGGDDLKFEIIPGP